MDCIQCKKELPPGAMYCPSCGKKQTATKKRRRKRVNGTGTVWKLSGKRSRPWVAQKDGQLIGYYATAAEADDALAALARRSVTELYNATFEESYSIWSEEHYKTVSEKSARDYANAWKHLQPIYDRKLRELHTRDFQTVVDAVKGSRSLKAKVKIVCVMICDWGIREQVITTNYAKLVKLPSADKKKVQTFTEEEIRLMDAQTGSVADVVMLMLYTGVRINELFTVKRENCHDNYFIGGEKTDAGRDRVIPVPDLALERYHRMMEQSAGMELLIDGVNVQRDADNFRKRQYYPWLDSLGIERKRPHTTRKTFISTNVAAGTAPEMLQQVVGHAEYSTTIKYYTDLKPETLIESVRDTSFYQQITNKTCSDKKEETP